MKVDKVSTINKKSRRLGKHKINQRTKRFSLETLSMLCTFIWHHLRIFFLVTGFYIYLIGLEHKDGDRTFAHRSSSDGLKKSYKLKRIIYVEL